MQVLTVDNRSDVTVQSLNMVHARLLRPSCTHRWSNQQHGDKDWKNLVRTLHKGPNDMHTKQTTDTAQLPKELHWGVAHPKQLF